MGTRGLTMVQLDGEIKVAQYGQWDHYPTGQGADICDFIQNTLDIDKFKAALRECRFISSEEAHNRWKECGADDSGWVSLEVSNRCEERYPALTREAGARVLSLIQDEGVRELVDNSSFVADSLFCEYAYVLDMDNEVLEVYEGFNKEPVPAGQRFSNVDKEGHEDYYPVKLWQTYFFKDATAEAMDELQKSGLEDD